MATERKFDRTEKFTKGSNKKLNTSRRGAKFGKFTYLCP